MVMSDLKPQVRAALVTREIIERQVMTPAEIQELTGLASTTAVRFLMKNVGQALPIEHRFNRYTYAGDRGDRAFEE
jgi:hypothetical protein